MINLTDPKLAYLVARYRAWVDEQNERIRCEGARRLAEQQQREEAYRQQRREYEERLQSKEVVEAKKRLTKARDVLNQAQQERRDQQRTYQEWPLWKKVLIGEPDMRELDGQIVALQANLKKISDEYEKLHPTYPDLPRYDFNYQDPLPSYLQLTGQGFLDWCVREGIEVSEDAA